MLTSEEIVRNELLTNQETKDLISNYQGYEGTSELGEIPVFELRELLTYVKCSWQLIGQNHPETARYEHWEEVTSDLDAMASCLSEYEREIHNRREISVAIQ